MLRLEALPLNNTFTVKNIYTAFYYHYTPDYYFKGENHIPWEFYFVMSGEVVVEADGIEHIIKANEGFLHKPKEFHKCKANNMPCKVCVFTFDVDNDNVLYSLSGHSFSTNVVMQNYIYKIIEEGAISLAGKNETPISLKKDEESFASTQLMKNLIELLIIELLRQEHKANTSSENISKSEKILFLTIKKYLLDNVERKLSLEEISTQIGYSVPRICYVFKKNAGITIIKFFNMLKIDKAVSMIHAKKYSVTEISNLLNFDTIQYFSLQFKKFTGFSPSQYVASINKQPIMNTMHEVDGTEQIIE